MQNKCFVSIVMQLLINVVNIKKPLQEYARWSGLKIEYKSFTLINTFYERL